MTKRGHLMMAELAARTLGERHLLWLKLGSILPDLIAVTYLRGHTFRGRFGGTLRALEALERDGGDGPLARLRLGWQLHYLEDCFTHPHNDSFRGTLTEHRRYEAEQEALLARTMAELSAAPAGAPGAAESLPEWLGRLHAEYAARAPAPETDLRFALTAVRGTALRLTAREEGSGRLSQAPDRAWGWSVP